ncbi:MAG: hypothetical protein KF736_09545 [Acidobacteria bacterium]|nr:hypothetical protein [Acidobacteriota bacterium]MCW5949897.1 hypothetical protein [Pyrinomonadaceae bacterium]
MASGPKIAITGFMGVGKSSVARHLSRLLRVNRLDLDVEIQRSQNRSIAEMIDNEGIGRYREIETATLARVLGGRAPDIISLGGGAWTIEENRRMLKEHEFTTLWLDAPFEHCWLNISFSKKDRPLARDKSSAKRLFDERQMIYCLAEWHFFVRPDQTSLEIARQIRDEIFS